MPIGCIPPIIGCYIPIIGGGPPIVNMLEDELEVVVVVDVEKFCCIILN